MNRGSEDLLEYVNAFLAAEKESGRIEELAEEYIYQYTEDTEKTEVIETTETTEQEAA